MGDSVCLQPHLDPKDWKEASKICHSKGARLLACPAVLDDVAEFLSVPPFSHFNCTAVRRCTTRG